MRFAIIGAGVIGTEHARLIGSLPDKAALAAVIDNDPGRGEALAKANGVPYYSDPAAAYAAEQIDAVSVCVPSGYHADLAVPALRAGKHVLIEKPIDISLAAADRIIAAEKETGLTAGVISQRRFQPVAAAIKNSVDGGRLGRLTSGIAESAMFRTQAYYDSGDWRGTWAIDGGGALMNQGIHTMDLLVWFLGRPVRVSAYTAQLAHERIEVEDVVGAWIEFENGATGTLVASTAAYPGLPVRVTIHGDQGVAGMDGDDLSLFQSAVVDRETVDGEIETLAAVGGPEGWAGTAIAHRAQYSDFIDAVSAGRAPHITTADGRMSLAAVLGVYASAKAGRPVEIDEL